MLKFRIIVVGKVWIYVPTTNPALLALIAPRCELTGENNPERGIPLTSSDNSGPRKSVRILILTRLLLKGGYARIHPIDLLTSLFSVDLFDPTIDFIDLTC